MRLKLVCIGLLTATITCGVLWARSTSKQSSNQVDLIDKPAALTKISGYYAGSSDNNGGRLSWFLRIDSETKSGEVYLPPRVMRLNDVLLRPSGELSFVLSDDQRKVARFEGRFDGTISGIFTFDSDTSFKAVLEEVHHDWLQREDTRLTVLYSSVKYVEPAGDLIGVELFLFPGNVDLQGSLTIYEGSPGATHALSDVRLNGNLITFSVVTPEENVRFSGEFSSSTIVLKNEKTKNVNNPLSSVRAKLPKVCDVTALLKRRSSLPN